MKSESRFRRSDHDPGALTRPDIVPAPLRFAEESAPAPRAEPMRELQPYPALRPHADEATVKYALVQAVSTVTPRDAGERPSDLPSEFRSGTRATPTSSLPPGAASTLAPASGIQPKVEPKPKNAPIFTPLPSVERYATPSISFAPPPVPVPVPSTPLVRATPRQGPSTFVVALILVTTTVVAAFVGGSLGDGSLQRLYARWFGHAVATAPAPRAEPSVPVAVPAQRAATPPRSNVTATVVQAMPEPVAAGTPAVRFEDLPPAEPATDADGAETKNAPQRKQLRAPHRR